MLYCVCVRDRGEERRSSLSHPGMLYFSVDISNVFQRLGWLFVFKKAGIGLHVSDILRVFWGRPETP